jgi:hypothetical protein
MHIDLDAAIEDAEAQIAELDRQREAAVTRLAELTDLRQGRERSADSGGEPSPIAKARLFTDLFRGREDVFAVRWENATKGRSGYSPRCANEWRPGICAKPKVRCGACQRQAFASLDVQQLLGHLRGSKSLGSIRSSPTTRAGCWRSISTAIVGGRTRSCSSTCASSLASSLPWSVLGPPMAPTCGSSSRTRYPQQMHAGSASRS